MSSQMAQGTLLALSRGNESVSSLQTVGAYK
jgi:hypothetical protein